MRSPTKPETHVAGSRLFDDHRPLVDGMTVHACQGVTPLFWTWHGNIGEILWLPGVMVFDNMNALDSAITGKEYRQFRFGNAVTQIPDIKFQAVLLLLGFQQKL